ncbi:replication initiator protein A [Oscillibacter sp. 1-3]|uniref:replication initiator protein A n=1 Tax=Oscillibacter sp. 1-3 TaxID=1235797 RepID=UPI00033E0E09|nr:replication initiator protein A [Oscillibacter sp. 1-3]EOS67207.1 hypothetical protein C816_00556 [Oscillibacter sp. 1-3]
MELTFTAKLTYARLLNQARLSQLNKWTDEAGRVYIIFLIEKIAKMLDKCPTTAKSVLTELEAAGLIERKQQQFSKPNHIYVKLPDG